MGRQRTRWSRNRVPPGWAPFEPLFRDPHLLTIAGNFWPRPKDAHRYPVQDLVLEVEPRVSILVHRQVPVGPVRGRFVLLHGLEGSSLSGYLLSMSQYALEQEFAVDRVNMRACGGTKELCSTTYHGGLTTDLRHFLERVREERSEPTFLVGYSLGGNVALKLAGELGQSARNLLTAVAAVSTPIDLRECVREMERPSNRLYADRFLRRLKQKVLLRDQNDDAFTPPADPRSIRSIYEFDDQVTARLFGFGSADQYYETQSSRQYIPDIQIPCLVIQAKDDPLIPFRIYEQTSVWNNPNVTLVATSHGGHLGFLSRHRPRFWLDQHLVRWAGDLARLGHPTDGWRIDNHCTHLQGHQ